MRSKYRVCHKTKTKENNYCTYIETSLVVDLRVPYQLDILFEQGYKGASS